MVRVSQLLGFALLLLSVLPFAAFNSVVHALDPAGATPLAPAPKPVAPKLDAPIGLTRLAPNADIWIDHKGKRVIVDGKVALRSGALEMFACPLGTKEHESVIAVKTKAQYVHAGLLAVGAKSGHPVRFEPEYQPATGSVIEIQVQWRDAEGQLKKARAQEWIKNSKTNKQAETEWVFAGSGFWTDPASGERYYHADSGDFICVSNFSTATLDLNVPSSKANDALLFEAFTDRIPPRDTPVRLILKAKSAPTSTAAER